MSGLMRSASQWCVRSILSMFNIANGISTVSTIGIAYCFYIVSTV